MNKKDYSKIFTTKKSSKSKKAEKEEQKDNIIREPVVIEEVNEDNIIREPVVIEEDNEDNKKVVENKDPKVGIVNCSKLNVRSEPKKDSLVRIIIGNGDSVEILDDSDEEFYKILTLDKNEGYCMKKFIDIK